MGGEILSGVAQPDDQGFEEALRPQRLDGFIGQARIVDNLRVYVQAALKRREPLDHVLFCGPPGLGKTTLARIIASEMGAKLHAANGPALAKAADLASILTQLGPGDVFFLDEIHRIPAALEEYLYSAMEDFVIDINLDPGGLSSRTVRMELPRFTLVGATTKEGSLQAPFRERFGIFERLKYYEAGEIEKIVLRSARILGVTVEPDAAGELSRRSRGTPRVANRFLRRARDLATVESSTVISGTLVGRILEMLDVDEMGLTYLDRRILEVLARSRGRPVGLSTVAVSLSEDKSTVEDVYEPFLIQQNLIQKTAAGRILTEEGGRLAMKLGLMGGDTPLFRPG